MTTETQAPDPAQNWEGAEEWMPLAWELCANECGEEACTELIWEGGPIPEPWGDRWLKYEDQAKEMIAMVRASLAAVQAPESALRAAAQRVLDDCIRISNSLDGSERHNGALAALRAVLAIPAPEGAQLRSWCSCCGERRPASFRPATDSKTGEPYEDLCCDECHYVIATVSGRAPEPQVPVALTDEQIRKAGESIGSWPSGFGDRDMRFARAIEAAHGIPAPKEPKA